MQECTGDAGGKAVEICKANVANGVVLNAQLNITVVIWIGAECRSGGYTGILMQQIRHILQH